MNLDILIDWFRNIRNTILSFKTRYFDVRRNKLGFRGKNVQIALPSIIKGIENVYMYDNTNIFRDALIISDSAKFIMKKNSGAAEGLTVVVSNHTNKVGYLFKDLMNIVDESKEVIVEEDVWLATNVTLLAGVTIGRGSIVGSGAVCRNSIPPYSIVIGNPAKIVGFKFSPQEIIVHEKLLYEEHERYNLEYLEKNYDKYFINRIIEIKTFLKN